MLEEKNSNFEIYKLENSKIYRVKRKLGERNNSFYDENNDLSIKKVKTKFKIAKDQYIDNLEFVFTKKVTPSKNDKFHDKLKDLDNLTYEPQNTNHSLYNDNFNLKKNSNGGINMELEKNLVEMHYSNKNSYLNKMMFM